MSEATLYEVLGVTDAASPEEITAAYRRLVRVTHPDKGGSDYLFRRVAEANKVLSDPTRRAAYDRECAHHPTGGTERIEDDVDTADENVTVDDGWTRVDDVPYGAGNQATERGSLRARVFGRDWRHRHYNGTPRVKRPARDVIAGFFTARPWLFVLVLSLALSQGAPKPAAILFVVAVLARIGSRRAARRRVARRVQPGRFDVRPPAALAALSLLGAQVVSGVVVVCLWLCGPLRRRAERRRYRHQYRDWV